MEALSRLIPVQSKGDREILLPYLPIPSCAGCLKTWNKSGISELWLGLLTAASLLARVKVRLIPLHIPAAALQPWSSMSNPAWICQHGEGASRYLQHHCSSCSDMNHFLCPVTQGSLLCTHAWTCRAQGSFPSVMGSCSSCSPALFPGVELGTSSKAVPRTAD